MQWLDTVCRDSLDRPSLLMLEGQETEMREGGPHTILEAAYWSCPVQVLSGATWLLVGLFIGGMIGHAFP